MIKRCFTRSATFPPVAVLVCLLLYYFSPQIIAWPLWAYSLACFFLPAVLLIHFSKSVSFKTALFKSIPLSKVWIVATKGILIALAVQMLVTLWGRLLPVPHEYLLKLESLIPTTIPPWKNISLIITLCVIPAVSEESLFRGFLYNQLAQKNSTKMALIVSAIVFSLAHLNFWFIPFYFILGLFFGWCQKFGNIGLPIMVHALNNYLALVLWSLAKT